MTDELHQDAIDDELRRRFAAGTPVAADPDAVLDSMRPRLGQARTRRRASFASAIAGVAVVVVVLAFALGGGGGGTGSVRVPPATRGPVRTVPTAPTPTSAPSGGSVTPDTVPDDHGDDGTTSGSSPATPDATAPTAAPPTAPVAGPAPRDEPYSSAGGSIVVHLENGQVSLASSSPAAGFASEVHDNGPTRVEVRFSNGSTEWRIRVDVLNGELVPEITQHG